MRVGSNSSSVVVARRLNRPTVEAAWRGWPVRRMSRRSSMPGCPSSSTSSTIRSHRRVFGRGEIVQIQEDHGKFPALLDYLGNEAVHAEEEISAVIKAGDLINEGAGLEFLVITYVVHRNGHVVRRIFKWQILLRKSFSSSTLITSSPDNLTPHHQGQGNDGAGLKPVRASTRAEEGVLVHVGDEDGLSRLGHGSGDPLSRRQAEAFDVLLGQPHGHRKGELRV